MTRISVDLQTITTMQSKLESAAENLASIFSDINTAMGEIDNNWKGPMKESASADKNAAEEAISNINTNIQSVVGSFTKLKENAAKIGYGNMYEED